MKFHQLFFAVASVSYFIHPADAALVAYEFNGVLLNGVANDPKTPLGMSIPKSSPISGRFYYETNTPKIEHNQTIGINSYPVAWYRQSIVGGLSGTIGSDTFSADSYFITVADNVPATSTSSLFDTVTIFFSNFSGSPEQPDAPFKVNDIDQTSSDFSIQLRGSASLYPTNELPTTLPIGNFPTRSVRVNDRDFPSELAITSVVSLILVPTPEPGSITILAMGLPAIFGLRRRMRGQKRGVPQSRSRSAFTLAELLVAIAIVGILVAILLPAISAARESARRSSCVNNIRQVGIALQNHEGAHKAFPAGARANIDLGTSWWVDLLPFLESTAVYESLDLKGINTGSVFFNTQNGPAIDRVLLSAMRCPSTPVEPFWPVNNYQVMMPSYVGISGSSDRGGFPESRNNDCCAYENPGRISGGGLLIANRAIRAKQVTDGLSSTLLVGECSDFAVTVQGKNRRVDGGFPLGWIAGTWAFGTPPNYAVSPAPPSWNITTVEYTPNMRAYEQPGIDDNRGANNPLLSAHPGGVNCAFADGSVHLLSDEIDVWILKRLATRDDGLAVSSFPN